MLAMEAIYGEEFQRDADGCGFLLRVVPFPGGGGQNKVSCHLHIRYAPARTFAGGTTAAEDTSVQGHYMACRYEYGYPHTPVGLRVDRTEGLSPADRRAISKLLHASAEAMAREDAVCGFDLVDASQDFLRDRNETPHEQDAVSWLAPAGCILSKCVQHQLIA